MKWMGVVWLAAILGLGACSNGSDGGDTAAGADAAGVSSVDIALTSAGCDPSDLTLAAGPTTFHVTNDDADAVSEFEILDGERVVGEVENITPGLEGTFTLDLDPGTYDTSCPGGTGATGTLTVTGETAASPSATGASVEVAVQSYRSFVEQQTATLVSRVRAFTAAVIAGDQDRARSLFAWAREPYEAIEPVAESFGDLDPEIDARENDVPAADWTGFHRIERALWVDRSLAGMKPMAIKLRADVAKLQTLVQTVKLDPAQIANGSTELLGEVSNSKITGEEDRYSHTDLWDFQANVDGARAAFTALEPLIAVQDPALVKELKGRFADVDQALDPYRDGDGFVPYTQLSDEDTRSLSVVIDALAEPLSGVASIVVLA